MVLLILKNLQQYQILSNRSTGTTAGVENVLSTRDDGPAF